MDELWRDGHPLAAGGQPPGWATCGRCRWCSRADGAAEDPFFYVADAELAAGLRARCGVCAQPGEDPVVVTLATGARDMPCAGDFWEPRR